LVVLWLIKFVKWKRNEEDPNVEFFINMQKLGVNLEFNKKTF
jgi:hypothetical protein